ncbi:Glycoside hydrolase, family 85 [Dillenia turbinata]|uniref:mannosyl-glycoprotein endo-beta-N-acetylglucosaminidase n=1 Tax=Dillenia turbinata TaxID=194707 RepID=A0AAN8VHJ2_9MAGN
MIYIRRYIKREKLISLKKSYRLIANTLSVILNRMTQVVEQDRKPDDPPPFDPKQPSIPVSYPLKTLEELKSKAYFDSFHYPFNKSSVPLNSNSGLAHRPRILVCHDMKGGYVDDKWVQGGTNFGAYGIWHWYLIDVFVYFSHALVTIPPPCWVNAAHKHGTRVLGTFITEWDEGRAICNELLSTKESAQLYAERLAELAVALGFDGWLLNMEINLDMDQIPNLKEFINHLTTIMHSSLPNSLVIWYDAVTVSGDLSWQNQLNENNKPFFDICDGIFVNYSWEEDYPKLSADAAGDRKFDVYMGIDVFGRGTYGGGQWNTNVALDVLKKDAVSAAIFAPGWVYESNQPPDFETAQNRWWDLVKKSWGILLNYPEVLPFYSNFDQGHGYHVSVHGLQVSNGSWNNISSQTFQPVLEFSEDPSPDIQVLVDFKEASYSGGANITFKGTLDGKAYFTTKLFQGKLLLGELPVIFTYSVKSNGNSLIGLSLYFKSNLNESTSVLLASSGNTLQTMNQFSSKFAKVIMPYQVFRPEAAPGWVIQESGISMNGYTLTEIHAVCYRQESVPHEAPSGSGFYAVLGHILAKTPNQKVVFPPSTSWQVKGEYIEWSSGSQGSMKLSVKINWKLKGDDSPFPKYNIYVQNLAKEGFEHLSAPAAGAHYIGMAAVQAFYVSDLQVPSGISAVRFIIQVCGIDGSSQKLEVSPSFQLDVKTK